jgi:hypothetical protein
MNPEIIITMMVHRVSFFQPLKIEKIFVMRYKMAA